MPNGRQLKQNRKIGVMKVVSFHDSSSKGICQKPELASSFEKIVLSRSFARFSSMPCIGWTLRTALLSGVSSTQTLTRLCFLETHTIPQHYSVGSFTGEITYCSCID